MSVVKSDFGVHPSIHKEIYRLGTKKGWFEAEMHTMSVRLTYLCFEAADGGRVPCQLIVTIQLNCVSSFWCAEFLNVKEGQTSGSLFVSPANQRLFSEMSSRDS